MADNEYVQSSLIAIVLIRNLGDASSTALPSSTNHCQLVCIALSTNDCDNYFDYRLASIS